MSADPNWQLAMGPADTTLVATAQIAGPGIAGNVTFNFDSDAQMVFVDIQIASCASRFLAVSYLTRYLYRLEDSQT